MDFLMLVDNAFGELLADLNSHCLPLIVELSLEIKLSAKYVCTYVVNIVIEFSLTEMNESKK